MHAVGTGSVDAVYSSHNIEQTMHLRMKFTRFCSSFIGC